MNKVKGIEKMQTVKEELILAKIEDNKYNYGCPIIFDQQKRMLIVDTFAPAVAFKRGSLLALYSRYGSIYGAYYYYPLAKAVGFSLKSSWMFYASVIWATLSNL